MTLDLAAKRETEGQEKRFTSKEETARILNIATNLFISAIVHLFINKINTPQTITAIIKYDKNGSNIRSVVQMARSWMTKALNGQP